MESIGTFNNLPTAAQIKAKRLEEIKQFRKQCINIIIISVLVLVMFIMWRRSYGEEETSWDY